MKLVIAEKPSVAMSLAVVLGATEKQGGYTEGGGYLVSWCVGHLVELAQPKAYGEQYAKWRREDLPIMPEVWKYEVASEKCKQLSVLKKLMADKRVESIVCATDAGREGELIFRLVYDYCGCKKPIERLWISSMEDAAIRDGFAHLRPGSEYDLLYRAAVCRAGADWLVGINGTRLFTVLYHTKLNVGRVMTPTLALVVQREAEISAFQSKPFYVPELHSGSLTASGEKTESKAEADRVVSDCTDMTIWGVITLRNWKLLRFPPTCRTTLTMKPNMARASAERIVEVLDESSTLQNPENAITEVKDGEIVFEHVGFSYKNRKDKECLHDISLEIPSGSTLGIIGATGSGKSSLVQLIPRLYDVTEGCVKVGGVDVRNYDLNTLRDQVAMVLQKNELFSGTIKENLRWGDPDAGDDEIIHACELAQADPFIQTFPDGYDTYIEQGGTNVSGGQKQRLCIARALLKKPKILILDDSTSAVDTKTDALIRKAFREEIPGTTKIIIAQRISSVQDADAILVLDGGKINGYGTHDELLKTNAIYREIYTSQTKGEDQNEN